MFLVEGYIEALSAAALGLDAIALGGTAKAARQWLEAFYHKALLCPPIPLIRKEEKVAWLRI